MNDFFRTMMGRTFFEGTLPSLVRELARLNDNLEKDREQRARIHSERSGQEPCHDPDLRGSHARGSDPHCVECRHSS